MNFEFNYIPINYKNWNFEGKCKNILHILSDVEKEIWDGSLPFQDKREDAGHAEFVTYFILELLKLMDAKREIVIPAGILHDTGWSRLSSEELKQFYLPNWKDFEPELRKIHQEEGVSFSKNFLEKIRYPQKYISPILEIISQHDTRKGFLSLEDGIVRDADKLWRFTLPGAKIFFQKRGLTEEQFYSTVNSLIQDKEFFYSQFSRKIARIELRNTIENI